MWKPVWPLLLASTVVAASGCPGAGPVKATDLPASPAAPLSRTIDIPAGATAVVRWVPADTAMEVWLEGADGVDVEVRDERGAPVPAAAASAVSQGGTRVVMISQPAQRYLLVLRRSAGPQQVVTAGIRFPPTTELSFDSLIASRVWLEPDYDAATGTTSGSWPGLSGQPGDNMTALRLFTEDDLVYGVCPPDTGTAPAGADHAGNVCGLQSWIIALDRHFPGSVPPTVFTDAAVWDALADQLHHSSTFGLRRHAMAEGVDQSYGATRSLAADGRRYCAATLVDTRPANLRAWLEDCAVGVEVRAFVGGHDAWLELTEVGDDGRLTLLDGENPIGAGWDPMRRDLDLSGAEGAVASTFGAMIGDGVDETVGFLAVCPCDPSSTSPALPPRTAAGTDRQP